MNATLPLLIQKFFTDRLCTQMDASPNTIASYCDTIRLLLRFASERTGRAPTKLNVDDLGSDLVGDFLAHVEIERHNSARSRNTRLAAIRSFFRFVAMSEPTYLLHCQRILAMPSKRHVRRTVEFLDRVEIDALLAAPNRSTWGGRRDHAILMVALQILRDGENIPRPVLRLWDFIVFGRQVGQLDDAMCDKTRQTLATIQERLPQCFVGRTFSVGVTEFYARLVDGVAPLIGAAQPEGALDERQVLFRSSPPSP